MKPVTTYSLTALVLGAFAANSILCRAALAENHIDPVGFTVVRLITGACSLALALAFTGRKLSDRNNASEKSSSSALPSAMALFIYAIAFSFAYVTIDAGLGALLLFGAVQATMLVAAIRSQEVLSRWQWLGLLCALAGLAYLVLTPTGDGTDALNSPKLSLVFGSLLMLAAGVAWGSFTLLGRGSAAPLTVIQQSFAWTIPACICLGIACWAWLEFDTVGLVLAAVSGSVTSGLGYALWYKVLPSYSRSQAAVLQLLVPVIAAGGGVLFLAEQVTLRFALGSLLVLGGVFLSILKKQSNDG